MHWKTDIQIPERVVHIHTGVEREGNPDREDQKINLSKLR